jgi:enoyl-CoA hydratase
MSDGHVNFSVQDGIASIVFDRPEMRNAMTWAMYDELGEICEQIRLNPDIRVVTLRGAGGKAFVAGTDIQQFSRFNSSDDGVAYERLIDERIEQVERLPAPTVAIVEGWAVGGGLAIAAACDFCIATPQAAFGVPIARTVGNCLSMPNTARVIASFGLCRAKKMLILAETILAQEALACGFATAIAEVAELDAKVAAICGRLASNAPITMSASKEAMRRIVQGAFQPDEELIRACYGSRDFKIGVQAFLEKKRPVWTGS